MLGTVLQLIVANDQPSHVRQAAAIYMKNRLNNSWGNSNDRPAALRIPISASDEDTLKQNIFPVILHSPPAIQVQLKSAVGS